MGLISRKIFPACGRMCICCPALRSRSRQPVKRYKKLVSDIFPKSPDAQSSERKIVKLCEYASKNPVRIPKITKYLEERLQKELRSGHLKLVTIIADAYVKLLCICSTHLAYFASSVLNITDELLDSSKQVTLRVAGCQTLARFIYSQTDGTYARTIEGLVHKVCMLAHVTEVERQEISLRASSLQCLSAMIWFMTQFSHIFEGLDEVVKVILENYESDMHYESDEVREFRHHWVDEVIRCEGKSTASVSDKSPSHLMVRPRPEKKELSALTREETESPKIWAQICIQRVAELAKESSTMRRMLEPMFVYFDNGDHWIPQQGLAVTVLSDMCYFIDVSENQQLILSCLVRHLDHKNVSHSPITKSTIVQVATYLARQIRAGATLVDSGCVSDLCRHLRKSLQATAAPISEEEINTNTRLQNSIETCLLEIVKGMKDAGPLFDYMTIALEKLPPVSVVARATVGSLVVVAHAFASTLALAPSQQAFPEALLVQLLKAMLHIDTEVRIGAHHIFHVLLFPTSNHIKQQGPRWRSACCLSQKKRSSNPSSTFASVTALLEKLRKEKDGVSTDKPVDITVNDEKSSPTFSRLAPMMDKAVCCTESDTYVLKLSEDQIMQLLSGFWIQASLPDNMPSNYEALSHSYNLTLISCLVKKMSHNLGVRFFQLPLSLRNMSFDPNCGKLPPARRRSLYVTASAMLMFAAKMYQMHHLNDLLSSLVAFADEAYLGISEHLYLYTKNSAEARQYGTAEDNHAAIALLHELCDKSRESEKAALDIVVDHLSCVTKMNAEDVRSQLSEGFCLEDAFIFAPQSIRELEHIQMFGHAKEGSLDLELSANSVAEEESSISSITNFSCNASKLPLSPSMCSIISIGQLLESAREVAGQVVGSSVSTSPLPYNIMASQCETLGSETRKKLSSWLIQENHPVTAKATPAGDQFTTVTVTEVLGDGGEYEANKGDMLMAKDTCLSLRLPPASPFDNFLRAVSSPNPSSGVQGQGRLVF